MTRLLKIGKNLLKTNGLRWTFIYIIYWFIRYFIKIDLTILYRLLMHLEKKYDLPGFNSPLTAVDIWDLLPWEKEHGEEWTISEEWKKSLIDEILHPHISPGSAVLEIGPGAGRWTEILQATARKLAIVDVSKKAIDICRSRFSSADNISYFLISDINLDFIPDETIDAIWSFDVFVHINPADTENYLSEFKRILLPGGSAVIHHPGEGGLYGGCRSRMTAGLFRDLLEKYELTLIRQFDSWGNKNQFNFSRHKDCISVFQRAQ